MIQSNMQQLLIVQLITFTVIILVTVVQGQNDGRYRPSPSSSPLSTTTRRSFAINDGRYRPANDGKYRPANDGKYRSGNDGRYIHKDVKYVHTDIGGGQYSGNGELYSYKGTNNRDSSTYSDNNSKYGNTKSNNNRNNNNNNNNNNDNENNNNNNNNNNNVNSAGLILSTSQTIPTRRLITTQSPLLTRPKIQGSGTAEGKNGWKIIRDDNSVKKDGYHYLFETENGILAEEAGKIKNIGSDLEGLESTGFYEYTGDDGLLYRVDYVADTNGFSPKGDHIPKMPIEIQKLLAYLATKPPEIKK